MPLPTITAAPSFSRPTETHSRRGRTRSSSPGTVSWRALFRRGPFFPGCWQSLGCLTGPSSPSSPSTGLSVLGSWTSSSCRWLLQCLSARPDLLFLPWSSHRYPGLHRLALYAWRLSSASPGRLVSPRRWLRRLSWRPVLHRTPPTSSSGRFTGHDAALRVTPSRGHPSPG